MLHDCSSHTEIYNFEKKREIAEISGSTENEGAGKRNCGKMEEAYFQDFLAVVESREPYELEILLLLGRRERMFKGENCVKSHEGVLGNKLNWKIKNLGKRIERKSE